MKTIAAALLLAVSPAGASTLEEGFAEAGAQAAAAAACGADAAFDALSPKLELAGADGKTKLALEFSFAGCALASHLPGAVARGYEAKTGGFRLVLIMEPRGGAAIALLGQLVPGEEITRDSAELGMISLPELLSGKVDLGQLVVKDFRGGQETAIAGRAALTPR